jgi:hypothetical protein
MNIIVNGQVKTLSLIDPKTGLDWFEDFIANTDALHESDQFGYDDEALLYTCSEEVFEWWKRVALAHQAVEDRIYDLVLEHGQTAVYTALQGTDGHDLETQPPTMQAALDETFGSES